MSADGAVHSIVICSPTTLQPPPSASPPAAMSQQLIVAPTAAKAKAAQDEHKFGSVVPLSEPYWSVKGGGR